MKIQLGGPGTCYYFVSYTNDLLGMEQRGGKCTVMISHSDICVYSIKLAYYLPSNSIISLLLVDFHIM